jgi:hypothetical protein
MDHTKQKELIPATTAEAGMVMSQATTIFFTTPRMGGITESVGVVEEEG